MTKCLLKRAGSPSVIILLRYFSEKKVLSFCLAISAVNCKISERFFIKNEEKRQDFYHN